MSGERNGWPLGALVEAKFGPHPRIANPADGPFPGIMIYILACSSPNDLVDPDPMSSKFRLLMAYRCWFLLDAELRRAKTLELRHVLDGATASHQRSFELLRDWCTAAYHPTAPPPTEAPEAMSAGDRVSDHLRRVLVILILLFCYRNFARTPPPDDSDLPTIDMGFWCYLARLRRVATSEPQSLSTDKIADYECRMRDLFKVEFKWVSEHSCASRIERKLMASKILGARRRASASAYCQLVGWKAMHYRESDGAAQPDSRSPGGREGPTFKSPIRSPSLDPCWWLPKNPDELGGMPRFLWDINLGKTVSIATLSGDIEYTAISHTWGRWRVGDPIDLAGVGGWQVPQNSRFDVKDLAGILKNVPTRTRYVWMDLLCIPQNGSIIGRQEIARQASIFRKAKFALAWLNDVDSFEVLGQLAEWMALKLLRLPDPEERRRRDRLAGRKWAAVVGKESGLLEEALDEAGVPLPNAWFTSLWTLQETALRPDIWLCTKSWSYLKCEDGFPIDLSGLQVLFRSQPVRSFQEPGAPIPPQPLGDVPVLLLQASLLNLNELDPVALVVMGNRRQCTERRAEAIMSALGVTRWYKDVMEAASDPVAELDALLERDLVLGRYPLPFVQELCRRNPGSFFTDHPKMGSGRPSTFDPHRGSLLPFSEDPNTTYLPTSVNNGDPNSVITHDSVLYWEVLPSGAVRIPRACIIASKSPEAARGVIPAGLYGAHWARTNAPGAQLTADFISSHPHFTLDSSYIDLTLRVKGQSHETFAVVTKYQNEWVPGLGNDVLMAYGVLLQRLESGQLARNGNFAALDVDNVIDLGKLEEVNWTVC